MKLNQESSSNAATTPSPTTHSMTVGYWCPFSNTSSIRLGEVSVHPAHQRSRDLVLERTPRRNPSITSELQVHCIQSDLDLCRREPEGLQPLRWRRTIIRRPATPPATGMLNHPPS